MPGRIVGICLLAGLSSVLLAQEGRTDAASRDQVTEGSASWAHFYLPASDGILGLRYGMDRRAATEAMRARDLDPRAASRRGSMRFVGQVLEKEADVLLDFLGPGPEGGADRLARIEVRWRCDGTMRAPRRIFESLSDLLEKRYGAPIRVVEDAWPALETGAGTRGRAYSGPQTEALVEIQGVRKDLYRVDLRLQFPPWADGL